MSGFLIPMLCRNSFDEVYLPNPSASFSSRPTTEKTIKPIAMNKFLLEVPMIRLGDLLYYKLLLVNTENIKVEQSSLRVSFAEQVKVVQHKNCIVISFRQEKSQIFLPQLVTPYHRFSVEIVCTGNYIDLVNVKCIVTHMCLDVEWRNKISRLGSDEIAVNPLTHCEEVTTFINQILPPPQKTGINFVSEQINDRLLTNKLEFHSIDFSLKYCAIKLNTTIGKVQFFVLQCGANMPENSKIDLRLNSHLLSTGTIAELNYMRKYIMKIKLNLQNYVILAINSCDVYSSENFIRPPFHKFGLNCGRIEEIEIFMNNPNIVKKIYACTSVTNNVGPTDHVEGIKIHRIMKRKPKNCIRKLLFKKRKPLSDIHINFTL